MVLRIAAGKVEGVRIRDHHLVRSATRDHGPDLGHGAFERKRAEGHAEDVHDVLSYGSRPRSECLGSTPRRHAASSSSSACRYVITRRSLAIAASISRRSARLRSSATRIPGCRAMRASIPSPARSSRSAA